MQAKPHTSKVLHDKMQRAIEYMRTHAQRKPTVTQVAQEIGMSVSRFEHAFTEWVGTTPKRFSSQLLKENAKEQIIKSKNILLAAYASGLSGPGRLHELMVTYEAVSPGEFKNGNIEITYGIHRSPFGWCVIGITKRGICYLAFMKTRAEREAVGKIQEKWTSAKLTRNDAYTKVYIQKIFKPKNSGQPFHLLIKGTNFQIKVWEALLTIPSGETKSYADIAKKVGSPKAVRAVGTACGKNSISYLIPCHRVLASNGGLGGYGGGLPVKKALLAAEKPATK